MPGATDRLIPQARSWRDALAPLLILWILLLLCAVPAIALAATKITGVRVWPGPEYTRITIETATPLEYALFTVKDPDRVVLDLEDVDPAGVLEALPTRIGPDDPFVREVRVGRYRPGVVRLVLDLKTEVNPQAFSLRPVGEYAHRLVLDVYPTKRADPLLALITELEQQRAVVFAPPPAVVPAPARSEQPPPAPSERAAAREPQPGPPQEPAKSTRSLPRAQRTSAAGNPRGRPRSSA